MLLVLNNVPYGTWHDGFPVNPLQYFGEVVIVFDPSKTNMACVVSTPSGEILACLEFSGNNRRKGPVDDTTVYCLEVQHFLKQYLVNCKVYLAALEQAITVKTKNNHHTNMVLTEIRANLLGFFLAEYSIKPLEINNWSWKAAVLPEGYRSQSEKGSKRYLQNTPFGEYFEADITDCVCILQYVIGKFCQGYSMYCLHPEECRVKYDIAYAREQLPTPKLVSVIYNPNFTVKENLDYYANRILGAFTMIVDVNDLDMGSIYQHSMSFLLEDIDTEKVKVVASRCSS